MDLQYPARNIHLPQELVDCIASHLRKATDITAARLVSRSFCDAATKLMLDIQCSPSELFTLPTRMELDEIDHAAPKFFKWFDRRAEQLVTQWTWLEIPCEITLEDRYTEHGRKFLELAIAPSTDACRDSLDDEELDDGKDDVPLSSGRKATCWGRMQEKPGLFCIVMQWHSRMHWNAYRASQNAADLRQFLEDVAHGCVATSVSEEVPLPPEHKQHRPLFEHFCEIRTVYFKSSMTAEQKAQLEATQHVLHFSRWRHPGPLQILPGHSFGCWLHGLRRINGENAVVARIVFPRNCEKQLALQKEVVTTTGTSMKTLAQLLEKDFQNAGLIGSESLHCIFHHGPGWRN